MQRSPCASTGIQVSEECAPGTTSMPERSMPSAANSFWMMRPFSSSPIRPSQPALAPSRATCVRLLAVTPPAWISRRVAFTFSSAPISFGTSAKKSTVQLPIPVTSVCAAILPPGFHAAGHGAPPGTRGQASCSLRSIINNRRGVDPCDRAPAVLELDELDAGHPPGSHFYAQLRAVPTGSALQADAVVPRAQLGEREKTIAVGDHAALFAEPSFSFVNDDGAI